MKTMRRSRLKRFSPSMSHSPAVCGSCLLQDVMDDARTYVSAKHATLSRIIRNPRKNVNNFYLQFSLCFSRSYEVEKLMVPEDRFINLRTNYAHKYTQQHYTKTTNQRHLNICFRLCQRKGRNGPGHHIDFHAPLPVRKCSITVWDGDNATTGTYAPEKHMHVTCRWSCPRKIKQSKHITCMCVR